MSIKNSLFIIIWFFSMTWGFGQDSLLQTRIHLQIRDQSIPKALKLIERSANVHFSYSSNMLPKTTKKITHTFRGKPLEAVLREIISPQIILKVNGRRILIAPGTKSNPPKRTISGHIRDAETGETLIGATVMVQELTGVGAVSNEYGFYSLSLPAGNYHLHYSFVGYQSQERKMDLNGNLKADVSLLAYSEELMEVIVSGTTREQKLQSTQMGQHKLDVQTLKTLPAMAGEPDLLKMAQLLPGVKSVGEGSSGLYVRGGNIDQNLILLDEAPVYNPAHFLGFFSAFNADAIHHMELFKAGFPVQYGGRLSSVLDLRMKEGNREKFGLQGGIGLLSSRISLEGPIKKKQSSFMLSARRTYPDIVLAFLDDDGGNKFNFYDLNAKFNWQFNEKDHLYSFLLIWETMYFASSISMRTAGEMQRPPSAGIICLTIVSFPTFRSSVAVTITTLITLLME